MYATREDVGIRTRTLLWISCRLGAVSKRVAKVRRNARSYWLQAHAVNLVRAVRGILLGCISEPWPRELLLLVGKMCDNHQPIARLHTGIQARSFYLF
jgi:hypothetical protein